MSPISRIVILGAGHAGATAAALLRQYGFAGELTLVSDEDVLPYQRPPLSKNWLSGHIAIDDIVLRPSAFYDEQRIRLRLQDMAASIDRDSKIVRLADGADMPYDVLVIATGSRPIVPPVPGIDAEGVLSLRSVRDAQRLRGLLAPGKTLVVVGAGYLGLEAAATARSMGVEVTLVERAPHVLARIADQQLADFVAQAHLQRGVRLLVSRAVERVHATGGRASAVELDDGSLLPCDAVLVAVGGQPNDELARAAGLRCDEGVVVDQQARTSDASIFAIGDVTRRPMPVYDTMFRLESIPNAVEQAKHAACAIMGRPSPAHEVPWQWSDQYDLRIQIAGHAFGADNTVTRGSPQAGAFSVFHFKGDELLAVEAVNSAPEFMSGRQLIGRHARFDKTLLADLTLSMRQIVNT